MATLYEIDEEVLSICRSGNRRDYRPGKAGTVADGF